MIRRSAWIIDRGFPIVSLIVLVVLAESVAFVFGSPGLRQEAAMAIAYLVIVIGVQIFSSGTGVVSLGHVGFVAIGAFTAASVSTPAMRKDALIPEMPDALRSIEVGIGWSLLIATAVGAVVALLLWVPILSLSGIAAQITTFGFLWIVFVVFDKSEAITGGSTGFTNVPKIRNVAVLLAIAALVLIVTYAFQQSRLGLRLRAGREDELAAAAIGIDVRRTRIPATVLSGAVAALGGALYAHIFGGASASAFFLGMTLLTLTMLIVGGTYSLAGAVIGTLVVTAVGRAFGSLEDGVDLFGANVELPTGTRAFGLSVFLLVALYLRPSGITGGHELSLRRLTPKPGTVEG